MDNEKLEQQYHFDYKLEYTLTKDDLYERSLQLYKHIISVYFVFPGLQIITFIRAFIKYDYYNFVSMSISVFILGILFHFIYVNQRRKSIVRRDIENKDLEKVYFDAFGDKIVSTTSLLPSPEISDYERIVAIHESERFIYLSLPNNMHMPVPKRIYENEDEFKRYIFEKCTNVKKKDFISFNKIRRNCLLIVIATGVVAAASLIVYILAK